MFKSKFWALLPLLSFVFIYVSVSAAVGDFYKLPVIVVFLFAAVVGFVQYPKISFQQKLDEFTKGAGEPNIMLMILIFLLAGAFAYISKRIGAVNSTVNFALTYLSPSLLIAGLFLTACFISLSLGTSVGTVVALAPISVTLEDSIPGSLAISLAAVVGGAMFGDNLSIISDTTIAATRTQGVEMRAKFKVNFLIALPAAVVTFLLYAFTTNFATSVAAVPDYTMLLILPYVFVFVAALAGLNVIWVLILGIAMAAVIGLAVTDLDIWSLIISVNDGVASMLELSVICTLIGGIVGLIRLYGGIDHILHHVLRLIRGQRSGEFGIAALTALVNAAIANNTITILIVGPLAKNIADEHHIDPRRSASILDTISCFVQGVIPYGAQLLAAVTIAGKKVSAPEIMTCLYYPYLLGVATLAFIVLKKDNRQAE